MRAPHPETTSTWSNANVKAGKKSKAPNKRAVITTPAIFTEPNRVAITLLRRQVLEEFRATGVPTHSDSCAPLDAALPAGVRGVYGVRKRTHLSNALPGLTGRKFVSAPRRPGNEPAMWKRSDLGRGVVDRLVGPAWTGTRALSNLCGGWRR